jgi:hypothetical protein
MNEIQLIFIGVCVGLYIFFGSVIATKDISIKEAPTPKDFHKDGYNWFGSWTIFLLRTFLALPFWILGTLGLLVCRFIKWILTV